MSNMLRGKFRDKIRNFFINRNKGKNSQFNYEGKETKKEYFNVALNDNIIDKKASANTQFKFCENKDTIRAKGISNLKDVSNVKLMDQGLPKKAVGIKQTSNINSNNNSYNIQILESKILSKVETIINDYKNKLEIIGTDIYVLNTYIEDNKTKEKCKQEKEQIQSIIEKINKIKEQYKILKSKNIELDYLGIDNSLLIDDIYKYKKLVNNINDISKYQDKYKKSEIFLETNSLLETIENSIKKLEKSNKNKMNKISIDEKKFIEIKDNLFKYSFEFSRFNNFIEGQNSIIENMKDKVGEINSYEKKITKFIGYDKLLFNNLKYISLLLLSPLKGLFPVIATSTLATKSTIDLLKKQVNIEESKQIVYTAENYEKQITTNISSVNDMKYLISSSISDIKKIKEKLQQDKSLSSSLEYKNIMGKINDIEIVLNNNKNKLDIIETKLNGYKKINSDKLVKVRKLNES